MHATEDGRPPGLAELKAQIRRDFPGWNLVVSDKGRWWAMHGPPPGEDEGPAAIEADSFAELYDRLVIVTASGRLRVTDCTGGWGGDL